MIANNFSRSKEFFTSPVQAGRDAREQPFEPSLLVGLFLLCAIILAIGNYIGARATGHLRSSSEIEVSTDPETVRMYDALVTLYNTVFQSPFILTFYQFVVIFFMSVMIWRIGNEFAKSKVTWEEAGSAMVRFSLITSVLALGMNLLVFVLGPIISPIGFGLFIYLAVLRVMVVQGIFDFPSFWRAFGVIFLSSLVVLTGLIIIASIIIAVLA